jgi:type I restriction enzyme S subunit
MEYAITDRNWLNIKLGDFATRITKGGTPTTYGYSFQKSGINFIKVENVENGEINITSISDFISKDAHAFQQKSQLTEGDILFSIAGTIGETCIVKKEYLPANTNQALAIIKGTSKFIITKLLKFQLDAFVAKVKVKARGGAMNNVSLEDLKNLFVNIPPQNEQIRLLAKMDELFSSLDKGIESLKTSQQQLKVYRQAVLKWAFEGKLTNAEDKIKKVKFGDVIKVVSGNTPKGIENVSNTGKFQFYKVSDMNLIGNEVEMRTSKLKLTQNEIDKLKIKLYPKETVIFPKRGGAILTNKKRILSVEALFDLNLMGALPNDNVNGKYLFYWFQKLDLGKIYDGSNVPQINNKNIEPLEFEMCSTEEQQAIVAEIESRLSVCDKIEESIEQSLKQSESLRQSILKKAFEGKLVPQDPADLPASKLLEHIKAEKEKTESKKSNKGRLS